VGLNFVTEQSPFGRIIVAPNVPEGFAVFHTTRDFHGRLNDAIARLITDFIHDRFGIESSLNTCVQVHGVGVSSTQKQQRWRECDSCDALWSAERGTTLGIKVADCLPIAMVDPGNNIIANVHSGWRGAVQNIVGETLDVIERASAFNAGGALAWLGPSIRACCFEVGDEVAQRFDERFVERSRTKPHVDLAAYTTDILISRGFAANRIFDSQLCTRCDGSIFHSFRRDGSGGRNLAFVAQ
jgi:YfiH family protein